MVEAVEIPYAWPRLGGIDFPRKASYSLEQYVLVTCILITDRHVGGIAALEKWRIQ